MKYQKKIIQISAAEIVGSFIENHRVYTVRDFYTNTGSEIKSFTELFNHENLNLSNFRQEFNYITNLIYDHGIISLSPYIKNITDAHIIRELYIIITIIAIAVIIKNNMYDLLVEIIFTVVNGSFNADDDDYPGYWSRYKIYSIFESYFINENITNMMQYLTIKNGIITHTTSQNTTGETIEDCVSKNIRTAIRYRLIINNVSIDSNQYVDNDYNLTEKIPFIKKDDKLYDLYTNIVSNSKNDMNKDGKIEINYAPFKSVTWTQALDNLEKIMCLMAQHDYDYTKIYRTGDRNIICNGQEVLVLNPEHVIDDDNGMAHSIPITNSALFQDILEPYENKIREHNLLYVLTNDDIDNSGYNQISQISSFMHLATSLNFYRNTKKNY